MGCSRRHSWRWAGLAAAAVLLALAALAARPTWLVIDRGFIDVTTGSRRGDRLWRGGVVTSSWHSTSPLEARLRALGAGPVDQVWVSFQHTERGPFWRSHSHGGPGIIIATPSVILQEWASREPAEVLRIHALLRTRDGQRILDLINESIARTQ